MAAKSTLPVTASVGTWCTAMPRARNASTRASCVTEVAVEVAVEFAVAFAAEAEPEFEVAGTVAQLLQNNGY